ncbi:YecA/YgfB family protein [Zooshikella harenae]|uniref:YecA family protein n=1 Tax=Zooshikella harenae TaxID=2827238 RepID=A0ABS5Z6X4_9GAMM|nr:YecA family protein [Zooshikella harenae]MBU2709805.1 YecA family protein [Zooshikella harenae]
MNEPWSTLTSILEADPTNEDILDNIATHGLLTAAAISPRQPSIDQIISCIFDGTPDLSSQDLQTLKNALQQAQQQLDQPLFLGEGLELPYEWDEDEDLEDSDIQAWCIGFMSAVFLDEAAWFDADEQESSELLLPIMALSGLFTDAPEFAEMTEDQALIADMCEQLPELLTELYLFYKCPEEKKDQTKKPSAKTNSAKLHKPKKH